MKLIPWKKIGARELAAQRGKKPVKCEKCGRLAHKSEWGIQNRYEHSAEYRAQPYPGFGVLPTYQNIVTCYVVQPGRVAQVRRLLAELPEGKTRVKFGGFTYTAESLERFVSVP